MRNLQKLVMTLLLAALSMAAGTEAWAANYGDVNKQMRSAQSLYYKGKAVEADEALKDAEAMAAEIMAGPNSAEKSKVNRLQGRLLRLRKSIDGKLKPSGGGSETANTAVSDTSPGSANQQGAAALPSHVVSDLKVVERYISSAQNNLNSGDLRNTRRSLDSAQAKLTSTVEHKKRYITPEHPEYQALAKRIEELNAALTAGEKGLAEQKAGAEKAAADAKAESDRWIARLSPYVTGLGQRGYDPDRYFVASYTEDATEMAKRSEIFGKVAREMEAYRATGPGDQATDKLQSIVRQIEYDLKTFQESTTSMANLKVKEAKRQIDYMTTWLNKEAQKVGTKQLPGAMSRLTFASARGDLDAAANLLGADEPRVKQLEAKYAEALGLDAKLAKARVSQTRMLPDKFGGRELNALKDKAVEVVATAAPGAEILRTTLISPDWKEDSAIEWTDTSRTALRHRVTRSVSAQVAGKAGGETTLYTIYIGKDRRTDGTWGPLQGHVMFKDPILEENVGK